MEQHEKRSEPRVRSRGQVQLLTEAGQAIAATVYDVSPGGMCVESREPLASGLPVRVEVHGLEARGVVRYCRKHEDRYQLGVRLQSPETDGAGPS